MKIFVLIVISVASLYSLEPLVNSLWLQENINDSNIRIIDVSDGFQYTYEHIPGAVNSSVDKWRFDNGSFLSIRPVVDIEKEIRRLGINEHTNVVLYAPINEQRPLLNVSYVYWALNYHGIKNVAILDGGLDAWKNEIKPMLLQQENIEINESTFKVKIDTTKFADLNFVKENLGKIPMLDARISDVYFGMQSTPNVRRNGHISGAMSYPWTYSIDKSYKLKPKELLDNIFKDGYGLDKNKEVIVYCTGGLETSYTYFVLNGVLGYKKVRIYDASTKEWANRDDTPMTLYRYELFKKSTINPLLKR